MTAGISTALVLGGGIGGLAAATALAQSGVRADLAEIRHGFATSGVGLGQPANGLRALRAIGVLDECLKAGFQFDRLVFRDNAGQFIGEHHFLMGAADGLPAMNALPRSDLHGILLAAATRAGAQIRMGVTAESVSPAGDGAVVRFTDGQQDRYDVVVSFDGIRSWTRERVLGAAQRPVPSGYAAWRSIVRRPGEATCMEFYQGVNGKTGFMPLSQDTMYVFHIGADSPGQGRSQAELREALRWRTRDYGGVVARVIASMSDDDEVVYSPIETLIVPPPWHRGCVVVAGDAVHASAPHLTQGASMALEDAVVLASELVRDAPLPERMERFAQRRFRRCEFIQRVSHEMLLAEQGIGTAGELRRAKDTLFLRMDRALSEADRAMDIPALAV